MLCLTPVSMYVCLGCLSMYVCLQACMYGCMSGASRSIIQGLGHKSSRKTFRIGDRNTATFLRFVRGGTSGGPRHTWDAWTKLAKMLSTINEICMYVCYENPMYVIVCLTYTLKHTRSKCMFMANENMGWACMYVWKPSKRVMESETYTLWHTRM